jgi:hypothetical protein
MLDVVGQNRKDKSPRKGIGCVSGGIVDRMRIVRRLECLDNKWSIPMRVMGVACRRTTDIRDGEATAAVGVRQPNPAQAHHIT